MIALAGQSVLDQTFWPDGGVEHRLGGAPIFGARAVAGSRSAVVVTHGGTPALRRPLHELGLEVVVGPTERTTVYRTTLFGDGTWAESLTALGDAFAPQDVTGWMAAALDPCSAIVCGAQWRGDFPAATLAALERPGRLIYLDGQGPARPRRLGPVHVQAPLDPHALRSVDVLKLSEEEALVLCGAIDPAPVRVTGVPVVVVTLGERGAIVLADGRSTRIEVDPVLELADTVGAGDSFLALMATAADAGAEPVEAARAACAATAVLLRRRLDAERPVASAAQS
ncbi:MAG: PfkB family carbohydrate kinase [Gaiellales bacterium]